MSKPVLYLKLVVYLSSVYASQQFSTIPHRIHHGRIRKTFSNKVFKCFKFIKCIIKNVQILDLGWAWRINKTQSFVRQYTE